MCSTFNEFGGNLDRKVQKSIGRGKTLKRVNLTRWPAIADSSKSLLDSWDEIITVLKITENVSTEEPVPENEDKGIRINLENLETALI